MSSLARYGKIYLISLNSFLPVARFTAEVHDGYDENEISFDGVKDAVGKNLRDASANILVDDSPSGWRFQYSLDGVLNRFNEPELEFGITLGVVRRGRLVLLERLPGGSPISSLKSISYLAKRVRARDRFHFSGAHFVSSPLRFRDPQLLDSAEFSRVQALHQKIGKPCARFNR